MRRSPIIPFLLAAAAAVPAWASVAVAQEGVWVAEAGHAWLGISYDLRWVQRAGSCEPRVVVDAVVQGSPAERAGLRAGDVIVAVDGEPAPASRLRSIAARLAPGDSLRLRFERNGARREVTAVADRRPRRPIAFALRTGPESGLYRTTAPVVRIRGDTVEAWNLEPASPWSPSSPRGYWVVSSDGRSEYRRLDAWSGDSTDQRVTDLLVCADTTHWTVAPAPALRVSVREIHARADSLRVIIARRALEAADDPRGAVARAAPSRLASRREEPPAVRELELVGPGAFAYRFEDRLAIGLRGVAGAEVTSLEPELAEYFRGVRRGLLVLRVADGSPADRAGLRPGDVITRAGGHAVDSVDELREALGGPWTGDLELDIVRRGRSRTVTLGND